MIFSQTGLAARALPERAPRSAGGFSRRTSHGLRRWFSSMTRVEQPAHAMPEVAGKLDAGWEGALEKFDGQLSSADQADAAEVRMPDRYAHKNPQQVADAAPDIGLSESCSAMNSVFGCGLMVRADVSLLLAGRGIPSLVVGTEREVVMNRSPDEVPAEIHGFSQPDVEPTPWSAGLKEIVAADTFWLSTVRLDGRPHVTPLIAVWLDEAVWFSTGPEERKAENLAANPFCILTTGCSDLTDGALDVVLEGRAERVTVDAELEPVARAFAAKYGTETWDYVVREGGFVHQASGGRAIVFRVRPARGLGFRKGDSFSQTTWRFYR